jgi:hypothetical protein
MIILTLLKFNNVTNQNFQQACTDEQLHYFSKICMLHDLVTLT